MTLKAKLPRYWLGGLIGSALVFIAGFLLLALDDSRPSRMLTRSSYDWSFDLCRFARPDISDSGVVIIYLDADSYSGLNQPLSAPWDRGLHATLLNRLKEDGAKAVIMDIVFSDPGPDPAKDIAFRDALRSQGRVVLAADYNEEASNNGSRSAPLTLSAKIDFPYTNFLNAAAAVGMDPLSPDDDFLVRQHNHGVKNTNLPGSLSWAAVKMLGFKTAAAPDAQWAERWMYYYGPPNTVPNVSYQKALFPGDLKPGFFRDKIVFIGARPITSSFRTKRDEMRNPYSVPSKDDAFVFMPMVEVHATQLLNLIRGDWLKRPSAPVEVAILALTAFISGFGLLRFRPSVATGMAVVSMLVVTLIAQSLFAQQHVWFPWMIIVGAQIPGALLCAIVFRSFEWYRQRRKLEEEQRLADIQIREQAALLDKAHDAIMVHDLNWKVQYWNKSAELLYGWSFEEIRQTNVGCDMLNRDDAKSLEALQSALATGEWLGELKQTDKQGKSIAVQSRWTLVRDEEEKPKSVFVINTDITEQKKLEAQFLRTQRMESIGTLAGGIAHDLNNVLSPIVMGVELLRMKQQDAYTTKLLGTMASSATRGSDMVKQVLTFARGHEGDRTVLQVSHLIKEMQKIIKETFPKSLAYRASVDERLWTILGDATQIHQILLNLCVNARDAMPEGGQLLIEAKNRQLSEEEAGQFIGAKPGNYLLLAVSDTGTGIPPEIIDKIFEPFFTTKEIGKGTGLGLSTVMSIIKSHGGFLDLKSEVGKGTTFNVYLPAAEAAAPAAAEPLPIEALRSQGETVMVVDDEPAVLELTKAILVHYGYEVLTAAHGAEALALYPKHAERIKVVIMDMMMPLMDGATAIRALRQQSGELQFIAISGLMDGEKIRQLLGEDIVFIPKPFSTEKLLKTVRDLIGLTQNSPDQAGMAVAK
jgi:two-component system, cell cycle sensor histidine kinase and response regulator CckA